jgi:hypothetical protein
MQIAGITVQAVENSGPPVKICRLDLKSKAVRGVARSYRGERGRRGRFSCDLLAFNMTVILPASDVRSFCRVTLLSVNFRVSSRSPSHVTLSDPGKSAVCLVDLALPSFFYSFCLWIYPRHGRCPLGFGPAISYVTVTSF